MDSRNAPRAPARTPARSSRRNVQKKMLSPLSEKSEDSPTDRGDHKKTPTSDMSVAQAAQATHAALMEAAQAAQAAQQQTGRTAALVPDSMQRPDYAINDCLGSIYKTCTDVQVRFEDLRHSMTTIDGINTDDQEMFNGDLRHLSHFFSAITFQARLLEGILEESGRKDAEERAALVMTHEGEKLDLCLKLDQAHERAIKAEKELEDSHIAWAALEKRRKAELDKKSEKVHNQKRRIKEQQDQIDTLKRKLEGRNNADLDSSSESSPAKTAFDGETGLSRATGRNRQDDELSVQQEYLMEKLKKIQEASSNKASVTAAPVMTAPVTTVPVTTVPVSTAPVMTVPVSTAPVTTAPAMNAPVMNTSVMNAPVMDAPVMQTQAQAQLPAVQAATYGNGAPHGQFNPAIGAPQVPMLPTRDTTNNNVYVNQYGIRDPSRVHGVAGVTDGSSIAAAPRPGWALMPSNATPHGYNGSAPNHMQTISRQNNLSRQSNHSNRTVDTYTTNRPMSRPVSRAMSRPFSRPVSRAMSRTSGTQQHQNSNALVLARRPTMLDTEHEKREWLELFFRLFNAGLGMARTHCQDLSGGFEESVLKRHNKTWDALMKAAACYQDKQAISKHGIHLLNSPEYRLFVIGRMIVQYCESEILHWKFWLGWDEDMDADLSTVGPVVDYVGYPREQRREARIKLAAMVEHIITDRDYARFRNFKMSVHGQHLKDIVGYFIDNTGFAEAALSIHSIVNLAMEVSQKMIRSRLTFQFIWSECGSKYSPDIHNMLNPHNVDLSQRHLRVSFVASPAVSYRDENSGDPITKHVTPAQALVMN